MDHRIQRVVDRLDGHWADEWSLRDLAAIACLSEYHFSRVFAQNVGKTPLDYLRHRRIVAAQELLAATDLPVTEVALRVGFRSLSSFHDGFKAQTGGSPSAFRRDANRKNPEELGKGPGALLAVSEQNPPISPFFRRIMEMNLTQVELADMDVAYMTQRGSYLETGQLWQRFTAWTFSRGLYPPQCPYFGISYDEPETGDDQKTTDVCVILPSPFDRSDPAVLYKTVPGGLFLQYQFYDRIDRLALAYKESVTEYLPSSPWELDDRDFLEFVRNDPSSDPEGKARIDLYLPVRPRSLG